MSIKELYEKLLEFDQVMAFNEPITIEDAKIFQSKYRIKLPPSYVKLMTYFDGGELFIPGTIIYGIKKHSIGKSIIAADREDRTHFYIPKTHLIIGRLNYGDLLTINLYPDYDIVQWDHEQDKAFCSWENLEKWLEETIKDYIRYEKENGNRL